MSVLSENIKFHRKQNNLTQKKLAKILGVAPTAVSAWELGRNKPLMDNIEQMSETFNIKKSVLLGDTLSEFSPTLSALQNTTKISDEVIRLDKELKDPRHGQWVSHGERLLEEQQRAEQIQEAREVAEPTAHYHIERPNISSFDEYRKRVPKTVDFAASAGTGVCQEENLDMEVMFYEDELAEDYDSIGIVMGSSMEPVLKNGDYLFVKITTDIPNGAISIWQVNGENYVKKFRNNGRPYLESLNPEFDDIDLDEDDGIRPLGVVVDVYREN